MTTPDTLELPEILDTCGCPARDRERFGEKFRSRRYCHYTNCTLAKEFSAGSSAGSRGKFQKPPVTEPPADSSDAFKAGWAHGSHDGRRQAISWTYPVSVSGAPKSIDLDPVEWFTTRLDRYVDYVPEDAHAYAPWEKPLNFIHDVVNEEIEAAMSAFDGDGSNAGFGSIDLDISFSWAPWPRDPDPGHYGNRWNEQDTAQLHQALGIEDAEGKPIELIRDPQRRRVAPPRPSPTGALPLPDTFRPSIDENYAFACRYLDEARQAVKTAVDSGIAIDDMLAGYSAEKRAMLLAEPGVR